MEKMFILFESSLRRFFLNPKPSTHSEETGVLACARDPRNARTLNPRVSLGS